MYVYWFLSKDIIHVCISHQVNFNGKTLRTSCKLKSVKINVRIKTSMMSSTFIQYKNIEKQYVKDGRGSKVVFLYIVPFSLA